MSLIYINRHFISITKTFWTILWALEWLRTGWCLAGTLPSLHPDKWTDCWRREVGSRKKTNFYWLGWSCTKGSWRSLWESVTEGAFTDLVTKNQDWEWRRAHRALREGFTDSSLQNVIIFSWIIWPLHIRKKKNVMAPKLGPNLNILPWTGTP